ncbi:MAG: FIST N-terminal domain-containing protein, partial [Oscillospiraceae bacterium]
MKNIQMLYKGRAKFVADLENAGISKEKECLVRIYTAVCTKEEAVDLAMEIHEELPLAQIVGASGSGVIFHGTQYEAEILVVLEQFREAAVLVRPHIFAGKTAAALAAENAGELPQETRLIHLLCGNHYPDIHEFIEEFNSRNQATRLVGGVVGDILSPPIEGYVFTEKGVVESGILTAAIVGDVSVFTEPNIAYSPMSTCFSIDKTRGSLLLEIQGIAGDAWCREQFGMEEFPEYNGWQVIAQNDALVHFPIMLEGHGGASRFLKYDGEEKEISLYFSSLPENTRFRIGYASTVACVQKSFQICSDILKTPVESLFCYSCLFRKLYIETCAKWELKPFWEQGISGVFMMGEICW